jgi:uncharacterized protein YqhQ
MAEDKLRLGGMALANGVLVHGPNAWACAVRVSGGELEVAGGRKRISGSRVSLPFLRGPARLIEAFAILPELKRRLPEARLPFERPAVAAATAVSAALVRVVRESERLGTVARETLGGILAVAPAAVALRGSDLAAYHGAEHVVIGTYEHGEEREKEHERCGGHLVGPLLATTALGNLLALAAPASMRRAARAAASLGAVAVSTEIFAWMMRNPDDPLAQALSKPGHELQHRLSTAEPSPEQIEVAEAALAECLRLEHESAEGR